mmetsp:Transcript_4925/g.7419  ORF Transcript_4925/g.7419 Transcript_4925/m.7419 type:complete len:187 (+) Transcript_4925:57-617(+)
MSECRLCLSEGGEMIAPCKCTGSIKYVHYKCLQRWLQEKNRQRFRQVLSNSNSKGTGLFCEICKFEYLGNVSYLSFWEILKKVRSSQQTYSILLNLFVVFYLSFRFHVVISNFMQTFKKYRGAIRVQEKFWIKVWVFVKLYWNLIAKLVPLSVFGITIPVICLSTYMQLKSLVNQCKQFKIMNLES